MLLSTRPSHLRPRTPTSAHLRLETLEDRSTPAVGVGVSFAGGSGSAFAPPDTDGSIGPNHYVQFINGRFAVYNKTTGALVQSKSDAAFWNSAGISTFLTNPGVGDPRMYYDPQSDRWFASEINFFNFGNSVLVGRSDTNDPTGTWKAASYVGDSGFADYPTLGVDATGVYIGTNNFDSGNGSVAMTSIPKSDLLLATPTVANRTTVRQAGYNMGFTLQGVTNTAANSHASVLAVNAFNPSQLNRTKITGSGTPIAVFGATSIINVQTTSVPGSSRQPDGSRVIDGLDDRIGGMVYQVGDLIFLVHGLSVNAAGTGVNPNLSSLNAVRLTVLRDSTTQVVTEATWFNPGFDYIDPSIAVNAFGDIVVGFTRSSSNLGSGATDGRLGGYAVNGRIDLANPGAGITWGTEIQLKAGQTTGYHLFGGTGERWGDYSATGLDPSNPLAFWTTQEYAVSAGTWGTWISQVFVSPRAGNVTSTAANGTYGAGAVIPITVTFNSTVTVTGTPQIALNTGGVATYASGSGTATLTFNYTVAGGHAAADLDYTSATALTLNGGTIKDTLSNLDAELTLAAPGAAGSLGANKDIVIDATVPRVSNVTSPLADGIYPAGTVVPITASFGLTVVVTGTPQIALNTGGTATYASGSGTATLTFNYTVGSGHVSADLDYASAASLTLNGGTIKDQTTAIDAALTLPPPGAPGSLGANKNIVIDGTPPQVTNVTSPTADGTYGAGALIEITVQFNRSVAVTGSPRIALNAGGTAAAVYASGDGTTTLTFTYIVGPAHGTNDLDYSSATALTLNGGTITEVTSGQNATLTLASPGFPGSLGANKNIAIVNPPVPINVVSSTPDGSYFVGANITINVRFSRVVRIFGTPLLALNSGGTAQYAGTVGPTDTLLFNYVVAAGENSPDLDYVATDSLTLNGGSILDAFNDLPADLTLPAPGGAGSLAANKNIVVDTRPAPTGVTSPTANGTYVVGAVMPITMTFNTVVTVTGTPELALNSGGTAVYTDGTGTSTLTFTYTVAAGESSLDLDYASAAALTLNGATIQDSVGQDASLTLPAPGTAGSLGANKNLVIDTTGPTVLEYRVLFGSKSYNLIGSTRFDLPWLFNGIRVVFSEPVMTGNVNSLAGLTAKSVTGVRTRTLTFKFPAIAKGSFSTSLVDVGVGALRDRAGNPIAAFAQPFKVLYGDFTDDGVVDVADEAGVRANLTPPYQLNASNYNIFADLSGDGIVNLVDVGISRSRKGQTLP